MSLVEYKAQMRKKMTDELQIQKAQDAVLADIKVSPTEVREFFQEIPFDSLPEFESEVELAQILLKPKPSAAAEAYAKQTAEKLRLEIMAGTRDFCLAAAIFSDDQGSKSDCGNLGDFKRGQMVPEFEAAVFKLKKDSISKVVKSQFGYHIIQLIERKGEIANARHILIRPKVLDTDKQLTINKLKVIKGQIENGETKWCDAVVEHSEDEMTSANCGFYTDPNVGSTKIEVTALPSEVGLRASKMKAGDISIPHAVAQMDGSTAFRILYLKSETPPHKASLSKDYQKLAVYALEKKKQDTLNEWSETFRESVYVWIDDKYMVCPTMKDWVSKNK